MSALSTLVFDLVRFGFTAMLFGILVAIVFPMSNASKVLIVGGFCLMFSGAVGVFVVRWWEYREGKGET